MNNYPKDILLVPHGTADCRAGSWRCSGANIGPSSTSLIRQERWSRAGALFLIFSLLALFVAIYVRRFQVSLAESSPTIAGICAWCWPRSLLGVFLSQPPWHAEFLPLTMTVLVLALAYNPQFALLMSVSLAMAMTVILGTSVEHFLQEMAGLADGGAAAAERAHAHPSGEDGDDRRRRLSGHDRSPPDC